MNAIYSGFASLLVSLFSVGAVCAQDDAWRNYTNERFGLSLLLPSRVFTLEKQSEAGDGSVFVSRDGEARLLVGAFENSEAQTPRSYQEHVARQSYADYNITYRTGGDSWFVLSGEGKGKTFYEKVMFSCSGRLINSFAMIYPSDQRQMFDPIVERIENSFRPGPRCGARSAAETLSPPLENNLKAMRPKSRSLANTSSPRSALADRIARQRGRDVIVILRRNGPPYDRRVLRGYVSR
jgi:hypothetical protein